jgi:hypothetical protein
MRARQPQIRARLLTTFHRYGLAWPTVSETRDQLIPGRISRKRYLARQERFELPTFWFVVVPDFFQV